MLQASIPKVPQNTIFRHHSQITRKIPFQLQKQKKNPIKSSIPVIFTLSRAHTQSSSWNEENKKKQHQINQKEKKISPFFLGNKKKKKPAVLERIETRFTHLPSPITVLQQLISPPHNHQQMPRHSLFLSLISAVLLPFCVFPFSSVSLSSSAKSEKS